MDAEQLDVRTPDGRRVEVLTAGPADGMPLVFNTGSPGGAALFPPLIEAAGEHGMRVVHYSRPGLGRSTPQLSRTVADAASDVEAILDALGAKRFLTIGWSGGGPHALASAALLPERCAAVASVSGFAPYGAAGLDWFAGMEEGNQREYSLAIAGTDAFTRWIETEAPKYASMQAQPLDAETLAHPAAADIAAFREFLAATFRHAFVDGSAGWRDDDLAFMRPWGFDPARIRCPVTIWHGEADLAVPVTHGRWLASQIGDVRTHFEPALGHGVLMRVHYRTIVSELVGLAQSR